MSWLPGQKYTCTPASISTLMDAPLPWMHMASSVLSARLR